MTRNAASVSAGEAANLAQAGLRGLMRVIDSEHPHLSATQIDVDDATDPEHIALQLKSGSAEDETAWRGGQWYAARLRPGPLRPAERRTAVVDHGRDGMRLQIRASVTSNRWSSPRFDRVPPGPGEIEVAVTSSTVNFADVLVAFGRYPTFEGYAWTGSARFRRPPRWWARRGRAPTPRPTTGCTHTPTSGGPAVCRPPRSRGGRGRRSAAPRPWPATPASRSRRPRGSAQSKRCCATTARTRATRRSRGHPG